MKLFFTLLAFLLISCSSAAEVMTDEVTLMSHKLRLTSNNGACFLHINEASKQLIVPKPPCYFIKKSDGSPRYHSYSDVKVDAVLIIVGTPINNEKRKMWGSSLPAHFMCGEEIHAILIKKSVVHLSKSVRRSGIVCKDDGLDEKDFWYFAHEDQYKK